MFSISHLDYFPLKSPSLFSQCPLFTVLVFICVRTLFHFIGDIDECELLCRFHSLIESFVDSHACNPFSSTKFHTPLPHFSGFVVTFLASVYLSVCVCLSQSVWLCSWSLILLLDLQTCKKYDPQYNTNNKKISTNLESGIKPAPSNRGRGRGRGRGQGEREQAVQLKRTDS